MAQFNNQKQLESWLADKPILWGVAIAARAALRAIPFLATELLTTREEGREPLEFLTLQAFRAASSAWVAASFPDNATSLSMKDLSGFESAKYDPASEVAGVRKAAFAAALSIQANTPRRASAAVAYSINAMSEYVATVTLSEVNSALDVNKSRFAQQRMIVAIGWSEVSSDASALEGGAGVAELAQSLLWEGPISERSMEALSELVSMLRARKENWEVWTDWYVARAVGGPAIEAIEVERVLIADEVWEQGPKVVNAHIKRLASKSGTNTQLPAVPAQLPAAVEPYWDKNQLKIPTNPAKANLSKKKFSAALAALSVELHDLAHDVNEEANIDQRPAIYLQRLADRIPKMTPPQDELFRLGHAESVLASFARTIDSEWPDFLASRYHALLLQFERTLRQSPLWREFKRNAAKGLLSAEQISQAKPLAQEMAKALRADEAQYFVDTGLPRALEQLAVAAQTAPDTAADVIEAGAELLAADIVESVNNTLKPIAEAAAGYSHEFSRGFKKAAKKQGAVDGEKAFKWLRRLVLTGASGAVGTGSFATLSHLMAKYPESFGWLERLLQHFLKF